jgi:hypothetical protein
MSVPPASHFNLRHLFSPSRHTPLITLSFPKILSLSLLSLYFLLFTITTTHYETSWQQGKTQVMVTSVESSHFIVLPAAPPAAAATFH